MLIAYAAKKTDTGRAYYVAAKLDLGLIAKDWIPDEMDVVTGQPAGGDPRRGRRARSTASRSRRRRSSTRRRSARRCTPGASRSRRANVAELRAQAETERLLGLLLVPVSTVIIAVGLGVALAVGARRAAGLAAARATSSPTSRTS